LSGANVSSLAGSRNPRALSLTSSATILPSQATTPGHDREGALLDSAAEWLELAEHDAKTATLIAKVEALKRRIN
jgi:hypothetical protein